MHAYRKLTKKLKKFQAQEVLDKRMKEMKARRPGEGEVTIGDLARSYINRCEKRQLRSTYMARIHVKHILKFFKPDSMARRMTVHHIERYRSTV